LLLTETQKSQLAVQLVTLNEEKEANLLLRHQLNMLKKTQLEPLAGTPSSTSYTVVNTSNKFQPLEKQTADTPSHKTCKETEKLLFRGWWDPLSCFYDSPLEYDGKEFQTAEHCYQFQKALFHNNERAAKAILEANRPAEAKSMARKLIPNPSPAWDKASWQVMEEIQLRKAAHCTIF
jgi:hypothetical protein